MKRWGALAAWLALVLAVAALGGLLTARGVSDWYPTLRKPSWTPPGSVFGPVWTLLYLSMGVAAWLVWLERGRRAARVALALFGTQLALNAAWSGLFFALRSPALAFAEILVLWVAIAATLVAFARVRPLAGALLAPYLAWVAFAAALNGAIWRLNA